MTLNRDFRRVPLLLIAAAFALSTAAQAQQTPAAPKPAAPAAPKPAAPAASKPAAPAAPKPAAAAKPAAASPTAQATLLGQFGDWGAYSATPGGRKVCFALSKPTSSVDNPPNRRTAANAVYMFISSRPSEKVKDEVSMLVTGYALKPSTDASLSIGATPFAMYTQNDGAWVKNAADETKLLDALRKGSDLVVKATTSRGTETTDTFSLKGVAQALDRVAQECK
jgi:nucleoid-associated protein YgaU